MTDAVNAALAGRLGGGGSLSFMIARTYRRDGSGIGGDYAVLPDNLGVNQVVRYISSPTFLPLIFLIAHYLPYISHSDYLSDNDMQFPLLRATYLLSRVNKRI